MKKANSTISYLFLSSVWVLMLGGWFSFSVIVANKKIHVKVADSSSLYLKGSSNINTFECHCSENFPNYTIGLQKAANPQEIRLSDAQIKIPIQKLDCHNKTINKDLYKALHADAFPFITVDIREAHQLEACFLFESCDQWTSFAVDASINIAETCRAVNLEVSAMKLGEDRYRLMASHTLLMTDFNIDPPQALMGLIKVDPVISIYFDLVIEVE